MPRSAELVGRKRPIEFQLLGITPPAWEPIDSLAVGRLLAWRLAENHQAELVRGALAAKFGEETRAIPDGRVSSIALRRFFRRRIRTPRQLGVQRRRGSARVTSRRRSRRSRRSRVARRRTRAAATATTGCWPADGRRAGGRSSRTIRTCRSSFRPSGTRCISSPPDLDVIGVTIPGVPFIALGHNARIAWGMTATGADVQDLALERVDVGKKRSMYRGEWVPIETTTADIPVRGRSEPLPFEVWKTRNGPIFADVDLDWEAPPSWLSPDDRPTEERRGLFDAVGCRRRSRDRVRSDQSRQRLDVVHRRRSAALRRAVDEHRLCRRRRQRRLRDVGQAAGARQRRRHAAGRRQRGAGVDGNDRTGRAAAHVQSAVGPDLFGEQRDRSRLQRPDHARLDGRLPRLAPARSS